MRGFFFGRFDALHRERSNAPMLTNIALVIVAALLGKFLFSRAGLPGILGMILAGVVLGGSGFDVIDPRVHALLAEFKTVALIIILFRAGLGISRTTLNRIGGPAVRMGFVPATIEGLVVAAVAVYVLQLPFIEACVLGFIIAAVSPAVVVPQMLELKDSGFGKHREVPTLVLAGASADNVFAITMVGVFIGMAAGAEPDLGYLLLQVPAGIVLGAVIGGALGYGLVSLFSRWPVGNTIKVIVFMIAAVVFYDVAESARLKELLPVAALLGIMAMGFVILELNSELAQQMAQKFQKVWVLAEVLLFVYIGAEVAIGALSAELLAAGLLVLCAGLLARSVGVWVSLLGTELNPGERLFCVVAYLPKATVQAAMGAVPLAMVIDGRMGSMTAETGQTILNLAVLAIVITTPLGAIGIRRLGPRLLQQEEDHERVR